MRIYVCRKCSEEIHEVVGSEGFDWYTHICHMKCHGYVYVVPGGGDGSGIDPYIQYLEMHGFIISKEIDKMHIAAMPVGHYLQGDKNVFCSKRAEHAENVRSDH